MPLFPQIKKNRKRNLSTLRIYEHNPQQSVYTEPPLQPTLSQHKSSQHSKKMLSAPKTYDQMIKETQDLLSYLEQDERQTPKKILNSHQYAHKREGASLSRNHKLIFEKQINLKPSRSRQINYQNDINAVTKIIARKNRSHTEQDRTDDSYAVMLPKRKKKFMNLEDELQTLRRYMANEKADALHRRRQQNIFKAKSKNNEIRKPKLTKREKVEALLAYDTVYFRKLRQELWNENASSLLQKNGHLKNSKNYKKEQNEQYTIHFPSLAQVQKLIAEYVPLTDFINVDLLVKEGNRYFREYRDDDQKQYLYFGQHDDFKERHGKGVLVTPVRILEGLWERGEIRSGAELQKKFIYKGKFHKNRKHGRGLFESVAGETYKGEWVYNKRHGHGEWVSESGESYVGDWVQGKAQGYGVYVSSQGDKYEGEFRGYLKCGLGKQKLVNGDYYEGEFEEGYPHGRGKYIWKNHLTFEGKFVNGIREGHGKLRLKGLFEFNGRFKKQKPIIVEDSVIFQHRLQEKDKPRHQSPSISLPRSALAYRIDDSIARMQIPYNQQEQFYETDSQDLTFTEISS